MKHTYLMPLMLVGFLFAHENWIITDPVIAEPGQVVTVYLCGGHYFPESGFAVKDKLVYKTILVSPGGDTTAFTTVVSGKRRQGEIRPTEPGEYQIIGILKRPQKKEPEYWMKHILPVGDQAGPTRTASGQGLEIIPEADLSKAATGESLPVRILYNHEPVAGTLSVSIDGKKNYSRKTGADGRVILDLKRAGEYMLYVTRGSQGASLTFHIGD